MSVRTSGGATVRNKDWRRDGQKLIEQEAGGRAGGGSSGAASKIVSIVANLKKGGGRI